VAKLICSASIFDAIDCIDDEDAFVWHPNRIYPSWFKSDIKVQDGDCVVKNKADIYIIPKIIFEHFYKIEGE